MLAAYEVPDVDGLVEWLRLQPLTDEERQIFEAHEPVVDGTQSSWTWFQGSESESERELRALALSYSNRPGYQEEWKP